MIWTFLFLVLKPSQEKKTMELLKNIPGLTVKRKKDPKPANVPNNINLPPGISISNASESSSSSSTEGAQTVQLTLTPEKMKQLKALGIL